MRFIDAHRSMQFLVNCAMAVLGTWLTLFLSEPSSAQELRYALQADQKFSYNVTITVDNDDKVITYGGNVHYTVQSTTEDQIRLTYRGGLNETSQTKPSRRGNDGQFGTFPRVSGIGSVRSPFSRSAFAGKTQTTNRIIMTNTGRVLSMEGNSQLPYLLGNVSLLPFESLPKAAERQWVLDSGVSISEQEVSRRPFGSFGPFGPGGLSDDSSKNVQAATEITRYSVSGQDGDLIQVKKTYELVTPAVDIEAFEMRGEGVWTFDSKNHVPHALDMAVKLIVKQGNSTTTLPITIKYERLSEEALAKIEADAHQSHVQAQQSFAEAQARMQEAKAKAKTPLTKEEKRQSLAALKSKDQEQITKTLVELEQKSLPDSDEEISSAIERLVNHPASDVATAARKALMKWSSTFERLETLRKSYEGPGPVTSSDLEVDSSTPLFVGQILQAQEHGSFWFPVRIRSLLPNGKVEVEWMQWGKPGRTALLMRRNLQLAPKEVEQPAKTATTIGASGSGDVAQITGSVAPSQDKSTMRTWSDASGRFKIEATYEGLVDGSVKLLRADGRSVNVPLEKLSPEDKLHVKKILDAENPFEPK